MRARPSRYHSRSATAKDPPEDLLRQLEPRLQPTHKRGMMGVPVAVHRTRRSVGRKPV